MKKEMSMIAAFHNQKDPDFNEKTMIEETKLEKNQNYELEKVESLIKETADLIKKITLEDDYSDNIEQQELLLKAKKDAKNKILEVLNDIKEYMMSILTSDEVKLEAESAEQEYYLKKLENADEIRKRKHNALISDLQSTIRFISHNFAQISEKAIEKWEEEREEKNLPILKAKRLKFPKNIICPDNVNIRDRDQVADWAAKTFAVSLEKIKKELS